MTEHEIGNCGQHRPPHSIAQDAIEWGGLGCLGHTPVISASGMGYPYFDKYGNTGVVKTTLEIPDFLFRRAKSVAAKRGIPLRQFVTEAVQEKLKTTSQDRPWMKHLGKLKHLHKERKPIEKRVEEAFEQIDPELWR